jgi:two-component system sensor histidine kinase PilS (NtrC family)
MNVKSMPGSVSNPRGNDHAIRWFVPVRMLSYVLILLFGLHVAFHSPLLTTLFVAYSLATLAIAGLLLVRPTRIESERLVCMIQFTLELAVIGGITLQVPFPDQRLPVLYLLTIVSASLCFRLVGTLVVASAASVVIVIGSLAPFLLVQPELLKQTPFQILKEISDEIYFGLLLQILTFYLIAFVSGYLAEKLNKLRTERDLVTEALSQVRLETDEILRNLTSGLVTVASDGCIVQVNHAAERLLGIEEQTLRGKLAHEVLPIRLEPFVQLITNAVTHDIADNRVEILISDLNGETIPLGTSTSILRNTDQSLRGVILIFSDLTDAKTMESRVRMADRMAAIGELSASIAHEIRNPLAAISGSVEVLAGELHLQGDNQRLMELIVGESERLTRILNEFLTYARIDQPRWGEVSLLRVLESVTMLTQKHPSFHRRMQILLPSGIERIHVHSDEQLLKQLLLNLTINAVEALPQSGGIVKVLVDEMKSDRVTLTVHNEGPAIAENTLSRIFEPFFSTKEGGTGLGLAIVHRLATSLEIPLTVQSSEATGTSFVLLLKKTMVPISKAEVLDTIDTELVSR